MELQRLCKQVPLYFRGTYLIIKGRGQCRFGSVIGVPNHTLLTPSASYRSKTESLQVTRTLLFLPHPASVSALFPVTGSASASDSLFNATSHYANPNPKSGGTFIGRAARPHSFAQASPWRCAGLKMRAGGTNRALPHSLRTPWRYTFLSCLISARRMGMFKSPNRGFMIARSRRWPEPMRNASRLDMGILGPCSQGFGWSTCEVKAPPEKGFVPSPQPRRRTGLARLLVFSSVCHKLEKEPDGPFWHPELI
jgi:hypothetical protein